MNHMGVLQWEKDILTRCNMSGSMEKKRKIKSIPQHTFLIFFWCTHALANGRTLRNKSEDCIN